MGPGLRRDDDFYALRPPRILRALCVRAFWFLLLREPFGKGACGLGDVLGRAGEGQADPAVAVDRVEIAPRGDRHTRFGKEAPAERDAVAGQCRDIDIEVEGALGRRETGQAGPPPTPAQP